MAMTADVSPAVRVQPRGRPEELARLVGGHAVPVVDREGAHAGGHPLGGRGTRVGDGVRVVVVAVEEDDPREADRGVRRAQVLDQRHERRHADVDDAREPDVRIRQGVVDGRADERPDPLGDAAADLGRDDRVGQQRAVRAVLLGRAGRDDDRLGALERGADLGIGHLAQEHGLRLHRWSSSCPFRRCVVVRRPIPSIETVTVSPACSRRSGPGGVVSRTGVPVAMRSPGRSSRCWLR